MDEMYLEWMENQMKLNEDFNTKMELIVKLAKNFNERMLLTEKTLSAVIEIINDENNGLEAIREKVHELEVRMRLTEMRESC